MAAVTAFSEHAEKVRHYVTGTYPTLDERNQVYTNLGEMRRLYDLAEKQKLDAIEAAAGFEQRATRAEAALAVAQEALRGVLHRHVRLVESGDCGFWDVEKEPEVIAARAAAGGTSESARTVA